MELRSVRDLAPALAEVDDHDLVYELASAGYPVLVTGDHKMRNDARVLVAVHQTRSTLLTIKGAGDDAILTTGVLLRDFMPVLRQVSPRGRVFTVRPAAPRPTRAFDLLTDMAEQGDTTAEALIAEHGRPWADRRPPARGD